MRGEVARRLCFVLRRENRSGDEKNLPAPVRRSGVSDLAPADRPRTCVRARYLRYRSSVVISTLTGLASPSRKDQTPKTMERLQNILRLSYLALILLMYSALFLLPVLSRLI